MKEFKPYIKSEQKIPEFSIKAIILGSLIAIVFGIANAYLGLKVGMTVSASIPAAVISMAILRGILKKGTILENNIVQSIGSSGESLAAGVIFTIPVFIIWSYTMPQLDAELTGFQIFILCILGGFLGILIMIPLRKYLIVEEHGKLPYPEGTACAKILIAGDKAGSKAKFVFSGIIISGIYKILMSGTKLWQEVVSTELKFLKGATIGIDATPALLGVGYIIGPRIAALMFAGACLGYLGISPLFAFIGEFITTPIPPADVPISELGASGIRNNYIKYMGAGAVTLGGFVTLIKAFPIIISSFKLGVSEIFKKRKQTKIRTENDLPMSFVLIGILVIGALILVYPGVKLNIL